MKLTLESLAVILSIAASCHAADETIRTSAFDEVLLKTVVSIERTVNASNAMSIGTGFLHGTTNNHIVLFTAKHVILDEDGKVFTNLAYRLNAIGRPSDLVADSFLQSTAG